MELQDFARDFFGGSGCRGVIRAGRSIFSGRLGWDFEGPPRMPSGHGSPAITEVGESEAPQGSEAAARWAAANVPEKPRQDEPLKYNSGTVP